MSSAPELDLALPSLPLGRWRLKERQIEVEQRLRTEMGLSRPVAALLAQRGVDSLSAAEKFLDPRLEDLHDPKRLPDFDKAVAAILGAKERNELVFIHGDYDVDGVTSASMLTRFLQKMGIRVMAKVPNRFKDGYGVSIDAIHEAHAAGAKLFLTCDCGVGAVEETELAHELGMKVVVTDHHTVPEQVPNAEAIVNPHRPDSEYPFQFLSGAGIAFKLGEGLSTELGIPRESFWRAYLDLAVLGTIADVMPLVGENRIIARHGLQRLLESKKPGINALLREARVLEKNPKRLRSYHVGFVLGPRLNAAGRIDDASLAFELLMTQDANEAYRMARQVEVLNETRKKEQEELIAVAIEQAVQSGADRHSMIVVSGEGWHEGVLGIVAGKLREHFNRPAFVLNVNPETGRAKGSGRSVPGVNLAEAIRAFPGLLDGGGHAAAAGMNLDAGRIGEAQARLHEFASQFLTPDDFVKVVEPDLEVEPHEITIPMLEELDRMEPFGVANPEPTFVCRGVHVDQIIQTKNPAHPQVMLRAEGVPAMRAPAFGMGPALNSRTAGFAADVLFKPAIDEYQGNVRVKWEVKDLDPQG